jgi:hypothetical protein
VALSLPQTVLQSDFSHSQAKTKVIYSQHTKHVTVTGEPFHFLHMGPVSDVTMWRRLCVADFGDAMSLRHCRCSMVHQIEIYYFREFIWQADVLDMVHL